MHKYTGRKRQGSGRGGEEGNNKQPNPPGHLAKIEIVNNEAFSIFVWGRVEEASQYSQECKSISL